MDQQHLSLARRRFLAWISGAGAFFAAHGFGSVGESNVGLAAEGQTDQKPNSDQARIAGMRLLTAAPLGDMRAFYAESLGLAVHSESPTELTIGAGQTRITFVKAPTDVKEPFYHFAFNIPENKILAARKWQLERTPLLPIPSFLRDKKYPEDVVNYRHWNAHSVFFFDPGGNVVEYIARHDLKNAGDGDFNSKDILYASEIAFVVDDVKDTIKKLIEFAAVPQYRNSSKQFAAVGDEHGLLLVMKRGRVISFNAAEKKSVGVYPTTAEILGKNSAEYTFADFPYSLRSRI